MLLELGTGDVPGIAVFAAATEVCDDVDAPTFHEGDGRRGVARGQGDVKAAVAILINRQVGLTNIFNQLGLEVRNTRSILTGRKVLCRDKSRAIEWHMGLAEDAACPGYNIKLVNDRRRRVAGKGIADGFRLAGARKASRCPNTRQDNLTQRDAIQRPALHIAASIPEVRHNQRVANQACTLTSVIAFRNDFNSTGKWFTNMQANDTLTGCPIVGQDIKRCAIVTEDAICSLSDWKPLLDSRIA